MRLTWLCAAAFASAAALAQEGTIDIVHINGPLYMLVGAGGNVAASVGMDGTLLVDAGSEAMSGELLAAIERLQARVAEDRQRPKRDWGAEGRSTVVDNRDPPAPPKPIRYILNTSASADRIGGNDLIGAAGRSYTGGNVARAIADSSEGAAIWAHEAVLLRLARDGASSDTLPTDTFFGEHAKLSHFFNGDGVRLIHMPAAQAEGATIVQFTRSDVIVTGDFFSQKGYPPIDLENGGSIDGVIAALNYVLDLAVPEFRTEGGTMIVPGYGRLSDSADVGYYRDMVTIIRDNIAEMISRGMSVEEVQAARPTKAYDSRFGSVEGAWTTQDFVEAVYRSVEGTTSR